MSNQQEEKLYQLKKRWKEFNVVYKYEELTDKTSLLPTVHSLSTYTWLDDSNFKAFCIALNNETTPIVAIKSDKEASNIKFLIKEDYDTAAVVLDTLEDQYVSDTKEFKNLLNLIINTIS